MTYRFRFSLVTLSLLLVGLTAHASATRPDDPWSYFHFKDGNFVAGKPAGDAPFVAVQDGMRPVPVTQGEKVEAVKLPRGTGAVVGISYLQSSWGKLDGRSSYEGVPKMDIVVLNSANKMITSTETDLEGYFSLVLPAGKYKIVAREIIPILIEEGKTALIPLRAGKRMVD